MLVRACACMMRDKDSFLVGVLSDTHGKLADNVVKTFAGVDLIIHAGDIDTKDVLDNLFDIAPVAAVCGNMDCGKWAKQIPAAKQIKIADVIIYALHDISNIKVDPVSLGYNAVIFGHTHCPLLSRQGEVSYINPGSATVPRYNSPASCAVLTIKGSTIETKFVEL